MSGGGPDKDADRASPRGRRRLLLIGGGLVVAIAVAAVALRLDEAHLAFPYDGPSKAVRPGEEVVIHAAGEECGPLIVSLRSPSSFGQWDQTHSGNVVSDSFHRDRRAWWSFSSGSYATPVPCVLGGTIRFTLPQDITADVVAACDSKRRCAEIHVDQTEGT
jgi:hypothetical protein